MFSNGTRSNGHVSEMLSAYIDNQLSERQRQAVDAHVRDCAACSAELRSLQATVQTLHALPPVAVPRSFILQPTYQPRRSSWPQLVILRLATAATAAALVLSMAGGALMRSYRPALSPAPSAITATYNGPTARQDASESLPTRAPAAAPIPASAPVTNEALPAATATGGGANAQEDRAALAVPTAAAAIPPAAPTAAPAPAKALTPPPAAPSLAVGAAAAPTATAVPEAPPTPTPVPVVATPTAPLQVTTGVAGAAVTAVPHYVTQKATADATAPEVALATPAATIRDERSAAESALAWVQVGLAGILALLVIALIASRRKRT